MDNDAVCLFEQDRQRFLTLYREVLQNPNVSDSAKSEIVRSTESVIRQMAQLIGPRCG